MTDRKPHKPASSKAKEGQSKGSAKKAPEAGKSPAKEQDKKPAAKAFKEIPLVSVPNEDEMLAEEMAEIFDEDRVTHKHGSSEPEAD